MEMKIPGREPMILRNLLCDYNGTLARDGELLPGVRERLEKLAVLFAIYIVTADTHGTVVEKVAGLPCTVKVIGPDGQDEEKDMILDELGPEETVAVGNGFNDRLILKNAVLGIGVVQEEGAMAGAVMGADIVCTNIVDALDLFLFPARLIATLRN